MVKETIKEKKSYLFFILLLASFLIFYQIDNNYLVSFDEAWYAEISRLMLETKNFLKMTWNNQPFFDKPPLFFWLQALSLKIFGLNEFGARFFSALSGVLVVYLTFLIGSQFNLITAFSSSLILISFPLFINQARFANLEMLVSSFIALAIFYLLKSLKKSQKINFFFLATALAVFTKGIVGLIPLFVFLSFMILERKKALFSKETLLKGLLILILINLPWYLLINLMFKQDRWILPAFNLMRFKQINPATGIDFFYYLKTLKTGLKLWFIPLPLVIFFVCYQFLKTADRKLKIIFLWFLISYISFSLPYLKNSWYITPIYPSLALLLGFAFSKVFPKKLLSLQIIFPLLILLTHFIFFKNQFWVPETVKAEVDLLKIVKNQTQKGDILYLDDNYHPLAVFYSQRKVLPLRFNRGSPNTLEPENFDLKKRTFFLSNEQNIEELKTDLKNYAIKTERIINDKILLSVSP